MSRGIGVTEALRTLLPEWVTPIASVLAVPGDLWLVLLVVAVVAGSDLVRGVRTDRTELLSRRVTFLLAVVLGGLAVTVLLKSAFGLPRPPTELQAIDRAGNGFPSGHTLAATILWGSLAVWGRFATRRFRIGLAALLVGGVAFSRLALGVHYAVDVVASVGFGLAYLGLVAVAAKGDPDRAFAVAIAAGVLAVVLSGASTDGILALVGTVGGYVAVVAMDRPAARRLRDWVARLARRTTG